MTQTLAAPPFSASELDPATVLDWTFTCLLSRSSHASERAALLAQLAKGVFTASDLGVRITLQCEFLQRLVAEAQHHHLHALHLARLKLIRWFLPPTGRILDVGGANGSMLEYDYPHPFTELILTDIPPDERIPELRDVDLARRWAYVGSVRVVYTSLTDLPVIADHSLDLVWVGQVVEHITEAEFKIALREIYRVLRPGGRFCFDTPSGLLTRIHSPDQLIQPEHKKEYRPDELSAPVGAAGITIEEELDMVSMPHTYRTKVFADEEMRRNTGFSRDLNPCNLVYLCCARPEAAANA